MRVSATGVADYEVNDSGRMVITACGQMFCATDRSAVLHHSEVLAPSEAHVVHPLQPKICPINEDLIACVSSGQLVVGNAQTNTWVPLTKFPADEGISAGMPSYVVQEEFDRYVGFWWQPPDTSAVVPGPDTVYRILFEMLDERHVEEVHLQDGHTMETHRYPKAGNANSVSDLLICQFRWTENQVSHLQRLRLPRNLLQLVPGGFEYLARAGWVPGGQYVWCQLVTRTQEHLELILVPVCNFQDLFSRNLYDPVNSDFVTGVSPKPSELSAQNLHPFIRLLVEKDDQRWIEINDLFTFLSLPVRSIRYASADEQSTEMLTFIWASRRSGYTHLYLMERRWPKGVCVGEKPGDVTLVSMVDAEDMSTVQLTSGPWNVTGDKIWIDEKRQLVYFQANREHPLLRHIYAVSYSRSTLGALTCLTPFCAATLSGGKQTTLISSSLSQAANTLSYMDPAFPLSDSGIYPLSYELCAFDPTSGWGVLSSSSLAVTLGIQVVRIGFSSSPSSAVQGVNIVEFPTTTHCAWLRRHYPYAQFLPEDIHVCKPPKVIRFDIEQSARLGSSGHGELPADGDATCPVYGQQGDPHSTRTWLYGLLFTPDMPTPPNGFPTVHYVYGGPGVQLVQGNHSRSTFLRAALYTHFGYALFLCDCRGSSNRGVEFAAYIKNRLGLVELDDHVAFLRFVAQNTGMIDLSRVAVMGCSYGGYLSLMAAMRYHHVYQAAIACSPVVDWALYDTAYTERYLGLPQDNPTAYWNGSVLRYVAQMPSDKVRLLICHGGLDENVHFAHTSDLVDKLETYGKPFQLLYYPNSRHGIREYKHVEASSLLMLETLLKPIRHAAEYLE
ncbi:hypothetical protein P879_08105 [Paragonimus westermani]|uniref:Dipeptidyl-peptidase 9 n=1 Tax=Paragonimus westermani TaxID=34504 RepID=A0A8T0D4Z9_9TREM|nr:hypothetical protein P879_08105 [Paragonimus westermani]